MADDSATDPGDGWPAPTWGRLLLFALATRLLVFGCGVAIRPASPPAWAAEYRAARGLPAPPGWVEPWYRFDAHGYADIAFMGYTYTPGEKSTVAMMPLLPAVMAVARSAGLDAYAAGAVAANAAFVVGLTCFGRAGVRLNAGPRTVWWACLFLVSYPYALFFSAPYHESLYFALSAATVLLWLSGRPGGAAGCGVLAGTARMAAAGLTVGFAVEWLRGAAAGRPRWSLLLIAAGPAVGLGLFFAYLDHLFGDPLLHLKGHQAWGRSAPGPAGAIQTVTSVFHTPDPKRTVVQVGVVVGAFALGIRGWVRRGPVWGCLILTPIVQAVMTGTLLSVERIALSAYPAALEAAELRTGRAVRWALVAAGVAAQVWLIRWYTRDVFIG